MRRQYNYAIDALLALAQIEALRGDLVAARHELDEARRLSGADNAAGHDPMIDLYAVRLLRQTPQADPGEDAALAALLRARSALLGGDTDAARNASESARSEGIAESPFREEYALLRRELGLSEPELGPIDPPFGPYSRFASRWALGQGASVVPQRAPSP